MLEKRWNLTGCAAALFLGLFAVRPAGAAVCEINWDPKDDVVTSADLNRDRAVDGADLAVLLGQWGDCPEPDPDAGSNPVEDCIADLNEDGRVDCVDREFLLGNWGRCEAPPEEAGCEDVQPLKDAIPFCTVLNDWGDLDDLPYHLYGNVPSFDLDTSGVVDMRDVNILGCLLADEEAVPPYGDVNFDNALDGADLGLVLGAVGQACPDPNQDGHIGWPDIYVLIERWKP